MNPKIYVRFPAEFQTRVLERDAIEAVDLYKTPTKGYECDDETYIVSIRHLLCVGSTHSMQFNKAEHLSREDAEELLDEVYTILKDSTPQYVGMDHGVHVQPSTTVDDLIDKQQSLFDRPQD